jgi:Tfp pilus assembly protein PilV
MDLINNPRRIDPGRGFRARTGGFTLVELMVSVVVFFLGVIVAGGVLVAIQEGSNFTESRYRDYADLRKRVEDMKSKVSVMAIQSARDSIFPAQFTTANGHAGQIRYELGAAGLPNLVWVEMTVEQERGVEPIVLMTHLRANE